MIDNVESLILERLRSIRGDIASLALKVDTLTTRAGSLEEHVAGLRRDFGRNVGARRRWPPAVR